MDLLVDCAQLAGMSLDGALCVFDCRSDILRPGWGREVYRQGHVPGARFADIDADLSGPRVPGSGRHPLPDAQRFADWLGAQGVDGDTEVIAYDQGHGAFAARLWWLLRAVGHTRVRLLDGGMAAWIRHGLPVTTAPPVAPDARRFAARPFNGWLTTAQVQEQLGERRLLVVDARAAERFAGQNEVVDPVAGHVPGAVNRPFTLNLAADGSWLPGAELRAQWQELLGERARSTVAVMCGSGVTACHHLFSLELAGLPGALLYAGSFSEWIADPARPVATGAAAPA